MLKYFYNFALFLSLLFAVPRLFKKKYRSTLYDRLGLRLPKAPFAKASVIWIHSISMGETRAVIPLFQKMRKQHPEAQIVISTTTETGLEEARKSLPEATLHFLLPFDFSWIMKRLTKTLRPDLLILVESDLWYNMLQSVQKRGGKVVLINGKISERSFRRFHFLKFFANKILSKIDHFCVQNAQYQERFTKLGVSRDNCTITGNIKFDFTPQLLTRQELHDERNALGIKPSDQVLVMGSTHPREEELFLTALEPLWEKIPNLKLILVPRHPERFSAVDQLLFEKKIASIAYTKRTSKTGKERIILMDTMGHLNHCYQIANIAIVGGSFVDKIGGHNILEPICVATPVLFGPYMHAQQDLVTLVLNAEAGIQTSLLDLPNILLKFLQNPAELEPLKNKARALTNSIHGATNHTLEFINLFLNH